MAPAPAQWGNTRSSSPRPAPVLFILYFYVYFISQPPQTSVHQSIPTPSTHPQTSPNPNQPHAPTVAKHAQPGLQLHICPRLLRQLREDGRADPVEAPRQVGEGLLARAAPLLLCVFWWMDGRCGRVSRAVRRRPLGRSSGEALGADGRPLSLPRHPD